MAVITLSSPSFFRNGVGGVSKVVGVESTYNRVARYSFTAPQTGAGALTLSFRDMYFGSGTQPDSFRFYIGTDPDSHINAGADGECTGIVQARDDTSFSGSAQVLLLPDTTYYLFVFPNASRFGWYYWEGTAALEVTGGSFSVPTLSAQTVEMGSPLTIHTNRHSGSFTHTLSYAFNGASGLIAQQVTDSFTWTPPLELARQIPNAPTGVGSIYCTTYQGDVQIGQTQAVPVYLAVPETVVPTVTATWTDTSGALDSVGTLVKLVSALKVDGLGVGAYGSTVSGLSMTLSGKAYHGGTILESGELPLVVTAKDSRGRTGSAAYTLSVADYAAPVLRLDAHRCDSEGRADDTGEFCRVTLSGSTVQVNGRNRASLTFQYGKTEEPVELEVGEFSLERTVPAPSTQSLELSAALTDRLLITPASMTLSVGYATMDFLKGGRGIAFGTTAAREGFVCAMDAEFLGKVRGTIFDAIYPVDSIYISYSHTNPADLFGGTWERITGAFLWATGEGDTIGARGGEATHTLTVGELPSHGHGLQHSLDGGNTWQELDGIFGRSGDSYADEGYMGVSRFLASYDTWKGRVGAAGDGLPHNNIPPYIQVSVWRRTA